MDGMRKKGFTIRTKRENTRPVLGRRRGTNSRPVLKGRKVNPTETDVDRELVSAVDPKTQRPALYDASTGEFVRYADTPAKIYEPYNQDKADAFLGFVAEGYSINQSLEYAKLTRASYYHWRRSAPDFKGLVTTAKSNRSEQVHEKFYETDIQYLTQGQRAYKEMDATDRVNMELDTKNIERKQKIIDRFNEKAAPNVFGKNAVTTEEHAALAIKVSAHIPDKYYDLIKAAFTPTLAEDGEFEVTGFDHQKVIEHNQPKSMEIPA